MTNSLFAPSVYASKTGSLTPEIQENKLVNVWCLKGKTKQKLKKHMLRIDR